VKLNETRTVQYGTIQYIEDEDFGKCYLVRHQFIKRDIFADTVKEAKQELEELQKEMSELNSAISKLQRYGYKVYKEVDSLYA
jgi:hypothetical protein